MNDRDSIAIADHSDLKGLGLSRRSDEHRDVGIFCLEGSPVVSECMLHVVVRDTVLAGARLDVHVEKSTRSAATPSTFVDARKIL